MQGRLDWVIGQCIVGLLTERPLTCGVGRGRESWTSGVLMPGLQKKEERRNGIKKKSNSRF